MKQLVFVLLGLLIISILAFFAWPEQGNQSYEVSDEYRAQVERFNIPDMPADWEWGMFASEDGIKMRYGQTGNVDSASATVVIIPGYTATMDMYGEQASAIASRGYHVIGFDLRGQGGSERPRPSQPEKLLVENFKTYSNDLALFLQAQSFPEDRPIVLLAMSFGGHVAFRVGAEHPDLVDGLLLIAPALRPKAGDMSFKEAERLLKFGDAIGKDKRYLPGHSNWKPATENDLLTAGIEYCASSPKRLPMRDAVFTVRPEQRVGGVTFKWGREFYRSSNFVLQPGYAESLKKPVTMVHAERDDFVVTDINKEVCEIRLSDCVSLAIPKTGHCLLQETDPVLNRIYRALDETIMRARKQPA
jgi:alpha-beta hydrolase superfamily lysophospholipase